MGNEGDEYPGDSKYADIVRTVRNEVSTGTISFRARDNPTQTFDSRGKLAEALAKAHNTLSYAHETNEAFIETKLTKGDIETGLANPNGYAAADWKAWAGLHVGVWYSGNACYDDNARWYLPKRKSNPDHAADDFHQPVDFYAPDFAVERRGWNRSHPNESSVWGWDPKEYVPEDKGMIGTHVGFPFSKGDVRCIVWLTPHEGFVECLAPVESSKENAPKARRTSAALWQWGHGQWDVYQWKDGILTMFD